MSAPLPIKEQIRLDQYLADCKQYFDKEAIEWYDTYTNFASHVIEDYILWVHDREKWMEQTL